VLDRHVGAGEVTTHLKNRATIPSGPKWCCIPARLASSFGRRPIPDTRGSVVESGLIGLLISTSPTGALLGLVDSGKADRVSVNETRTGMVGPHSAKHRIAGVIADKADVQE
jgi:hypothetical protein